MGLITILIILLIEWTQGNTLVPETAISMLAMVYFVFLSINTFGYFALTNVQAFLAILLRVS